MKDWLRLEADNTGENRAKFHVFESCEKVPLTISSLTCGMSTRGRLPMARM
jgi:hypothetical protein